jgi:hypothetical protein
MAAPIELEIGFGVLRFTPIKKLPKGSFFIGGINLLSQAS